MIQVVIENLNLILSIIVLFGVLVPFMSEMAGIDDEEM
jgi:hypothetical protein